MDLRDLKKEPDGFHTWEPSGGPTKHSFLGMGQGTDGGKATCGGSAFGF